MKNIWLKLLALLFLAGMFSFARADYPERSIRIIVPFTAGGATDLLARMIGKKLTQAWGQQVVVDNRTGANGIIAYELAAKANPDGHTLLFVAISHAINPLLQKLPYNTDKDFAPVSLVALTHSLLLVNPSVPVKSVKELIELAKAQPGKLNYASGTTGASAHFGAELLKLNKLGTLARGKSADFIVLDANPLENIGNTKKIAKVYQRGQAVDRAEVMTTRQQHRAGAAFGADLDPSLPLQLRLPQELRSLDRPDRQQQRRAHDRLHPNRTPRGGTFEAEVQIRIERRVDERLQIEHAAHADVLKADPSHARLTPPAGPDRGHGRLANGQ